MMDGIAVWLTQNDPFRSNLRKPSHGPVSALVSVAAVVGLVCAYGVDQLFMVPLPPPITYTYIRGEGSPLIPMESGIIPGTPDYVSDGKAWAAGQSVLVGTSGSGQSVLQTAVHKALDTVLAVNMNYSTILATLSAASNFAMLHANGSVAPFYGELSSSISGCPGGGERSGNVDCEIAPLWRNVSLATTAKLPVGVNASVKLCAVGARRWFCSASLQCVDNCSPETIISCAARVGSMDVMHCSAFGESNVWRMKVMVAVWSSTLLGEGFELSIGPPTPAGIFHPSANIEMTAATFAWLVDDEISVTARMAVSRSITSIFALLGAFVLSSVSLVRLVGANGKRLFTVIDNSVKARYCCRIAMYLMFALVQGCVIIVAVSYSFVVVALRSISWYVIVLTASLGFLTAVVWSMVVVGSQCSVHTRERITWPLLPLVFGTVLMCVTSLLGILLHDLGIEHNGYVAGLLTSCAFETTLCVGLAWARLKNFLETFSGRTCLAVSLTMFMLNAELFIYNSAVDIVSFYGMPPTFSAFGFLQLLWAAIVVFVGHQRCCLLNHAGLAFGLRLVTAAIVGASGLVAVVAVSARSFGFAMALCAVLFPAATYLVVALIQLALDSKPRARVESEKSYSANDDSQPAGNCRTGKDGLIVPLLELR